MKREDAKVAAAAPAKSNLERVGFAMRDLEWVERAQGSWIADSGGCRAYVRFIGRRWSWTWSRWSGHAETAEAARAAVRDAVRGGGS